MGARDVFVFCYTPGGGMTVVRREGGAADEVVERVTANPDATFTVNASFAGVTTWGAGEASETTLESEAPADVVSTHRRNGALVSLALAQPAP